MKIHFSYCKSLDLDARPLDGKAERKLSYKGSDSSRLARNSCIIRSHFRSLLISVEAYTIERCRYNWRCGNMRCAQVSKCFNSVADSRKAVTNQVK